MLEAFIFTDILKHKEVQRRISRSFSFVTQNRLLNSDSDLISRAHNCWSISSKCCASESIHQKLELVHEAVNMKLGVFVLLLLLIHPK